MEYVLTTQGLSKHYGHFKDVYKRQVLEDAQFRIGLSVNQLNENKKLCFGSDIVSSYHIWLDGRADAENRESGKRTFQAGQTFSLSLIHI